jgi:hypothetical protein
MKNVVFWDVTPFGSYRYGHIPPKYLFLQEPRDVTSQKIAFIYLCLLICYTAINSAVWYLQDNVFSTVK